MNTPDLKNAQDALKAGAANLKESAQELTEKAKEAYNNPQVQEAISKGKEVLGQAKDKLEDFVEEKTDGKGIFGFGKK